MHSDDLTPIGLDFGTATTLLASAAGVVPIGVTWPWLPSVLGYDDDGALLVGEAALDLGDSADHQIVRSIKRSITERRDWVQVQTPDGVRDVRADELIAQLLRTAAARAQSAGRDLAGSRALRVACPAMWDGPQRQRLVAAAQLAGLPVTLASMIDEPIAAGISWLAATQSRLNAPLRVLVFDMGGGTLDVAVLAVRPGASSAPTVGEASGAELPEVTVLAAVGVPEGGDALDEAIAGELDFALACAGVDIDSFEYPQRARLRLLRAAREVKVGLSTEEEFPVELPARQFGRPGLWYRRAELAAAFAPQLDRARQCISAALQVALLTEPHTSSAYEIARTSFDELASSVDVVVLSGGMSRIPYLSEWMRELFDIGTRVELATASPEEAVALGLAQAGRVVRVNLYRPAFDVVVEWDRGSQFRTVYTAHTPLVAAAQIVGGGRDLRYVRTGAQLGLPRRAKGRLRLVSHSGQRVAAQLGGQALDGFPVALNEQKFEFSLYPNGAIRLIDGAGTYDGWLENWPAAPSPAAGTVPLQLSEDRVSPRSAASAPWTG